MRNTDTDFDKILDKLVASTRSPRGRYSANESYKLLEPKLKGRKAKIFRIPSILKAAAAILVLGVLSWCIYEYAVPPRMLTISTLADCTTIDLPDGSRVMLNRFSSLSYPKRFGRSDRRVSLSGEGYFSVEKDQKHPFIVEAEELMIEVLGTRFNVDAYSNNPEIITTLYQGSVSVSTSTGEESVVLQPNESAVFNKENHTLLREQSEDTDISMAWQNNNFIFNKTKLTEIARKLSNHFNVDIIIQDLELNDYHLTARFTNGESLEEILTLLQTGRQFNYKKTAKDRIIIYKKL